MKSPPLLTRVSLPAYWRHLLASALLAQRRRGDFADAFETAVADLFALDMGRLTQMDELIRASLRYRVPAAYPLGEIRIESLQATPLHAQACLFVSACHGNGYVREQALQDFSAYPGRLALTAALIRCDDWVDPVRHQAEQLLGRLLLRDDGVLFDSLELMLRLTARSRFRDGVWRRRVEPGLRSPRHAQARWSLISNASARVREWAYEAIHECDPQRRNEAFLAALNDPHPRIALHALRGLSENINPAGRDVHLDRAIHHKHPAVRSEALRQLQGFGLPMAHPRLRSALLDRATSPRRVAAYLLKTHYGEEAAAHWRQAAAQSSGQDAYAALTALADCAQPEDVALFKRWFAHSSPSIRRHALRGLLRAQTPDLQSVLTQALQDHNSKLVKAALDGFNNGQAAITLAILHQTWAHQAMPEHREWLIAATASMDKWQALAFLLYAFAQDNPDRLQAQVVQHLRDWSNTGRYRFGAWSPGEASALAGLLNQARPRLPNDLANDIDATMEAAAR